jgi:hypothetical protein
VAAAVVLLGAVAISLAGRGAPSTVRTGSNGGDDSTSTTSAPPAAPAIDWSTSTVSMTADQLTITANGQDFTPPTAADQVDVHSDPGNAPPSGYTTLEITWQQHGVEMRMNIYFSSDAQKWWADQIRIYNGKPGGSADWITFDGHWFETPLGQSYAGDLHLTKDGGSLDIKGLNLQGFLRPKACAEHQTPDALESLYTTIDMGMPGGFGAGVRLYDSTCTPVTNLSGVSFTWTPTDPTVVTVTARADQPGYADLTAEKDGSTVVQVVARDTATGAVLATTAVPVKVTG